MPAAWLAALLARHSSWQARTVFCAGFVVVAAGFVGVTGLAGAVAVGCAVALAERHFSTNAFWVTPATSLAALFARHSSWHARTVFC
jgi:hypothetical protein